MLSLRSATVSSKCCFQILHHLYYSTATLTNDSYAKYMSDSFGFSRQQALSISAKLSLQRKYKVYDSEFAENANSVNTLFHNLGFDDRIIRNIVSRVPRLLASNVDKTLKPKIRALQDEDFSASDIIRVISICPTILLYRLESTILPLIHTLRQVMGSNNNVINTIERLREADFRNVAKCLLSTVALWSSYGVPIELIRKHLLNQPGYFVRNPEVCKDIMMRADEKLGVTRPSPMNLRGFNLISGMSEETFASKCQIFMSFGWTRSDIETFIMKNRRRFAFSDERIKKKLDFLMNKLQLKPGYLTSHNVFITCSLEKRVVPRHKILLILKEKGLFKKKLSLCSAIEMSEPCFLRRFVLPFKEVHEAYAKLTGCSLQILAQESAVNISKTDSYANYLVNSLGFSLQQSLSISKKLTQRRSNKVNDSDFIANADSIVTLFHNLGFDKTLVRNIVSKECRVLTSNIDKTLKPKIRVLQDECFSASDIIRVISRCPSILRLGLDSTILPAIHILKQVMGSVGDVINAIERFSEWHIRAIVRCLLPNVALLTSYGVPMELIRKQILYKPKCYVRNPEVFKDIIMRVENKLGITRDSPMFLYGINLICGIREETFESKCRIFKSFGWTHSDIEKFIIKNASCFRLSAELLKKKLDFLMNELHLKPAYLTSYNGFLTCSLEKRIVPRHKILLVLKEKGLFKKNPSLYSVITMSEPCFLKKFVLAFKEVHQDYAKLTGCSLQMLTQESAVIISTTDSYANYLVNSLGFSRKQSLSISTKLTQRRKNKVIDSDFIVNADSVVTLFHNLGFNKTHIRNIVSNECRVLTSNVNRTLKPKIRVLQDKYFSASAIISVISRCPSILRFGLESTILPAISILMQVMGSVGYVVHAIERFSKWHIRAIVTCLLPNVTLLTSYGVPIESIRKQILYKPKCYVRNPEVFKDIAMRVENKLGITRDSSMFLYGINLMCGISEETFLSKCRIFKSFGWTQSDVETFIIKNASCFTFSDEHFKMKLDFLMSELQLKPAYLTSHNIFITCSLERRIVPRHKILLILKDKDLFKKNPSLYSAITMSEPCFLKRFVLPFKDVHQYYAKLTSSSL